MDQHTLLIYRFKNYLIQAKKEDGVHCNIKEILEQLLLIPDVKEAIQANDNVINLRLAADRSKTSNQIGTVIAVFSILEEKNNGCDHQCTIALYSGKDIYCENILPVHCMILKNVHTPSTEGIGNFWGGGGGGQQVQQILRNVSSLIEISRDVGGEDFIKNPCHGGMDILWNRTLFCYGVDCKVLHTNKNSSSISN